MIINMTLMTTVVAETLYPIDPSVAGFLFACLFVQLVAFRIMIGHTPEESARICSELGQKWMQAVQWVDYIAYSPIASALPSPLRPALHPTASI